MDTLLGHRRPRKRTAVCGLFFYAAGIAAVSARVLPAPEGIMAADIFLTPEGLAKLEAELRDAKVVKRKEIVTAIQEARAQGDLSENAEYDAAKEAQAYNEKRIADLEDMLNRAQLIDESKVPKDKVCIGKWVKLHNVKTNKDVTYHLVAPEEADFGAGKLSISSPIGKALVGRALGDFVEVVAPAGTTKYKLLDMGM
jgi:transcription elongation factor GreA